jgi:hypothetical protein
MDGRPPLILSACLAFLLLASRAACLPDFCNKCFPVDVSELAKPLPPTARIAVIIGHQKSGTTFLHAALTKQHAVNPAKNKVSPWRWRPTQLLPLLHCSAASGARRGRRG